jgi:hypothetical protein
MVACGNFSVICLQLSGPPRAQWFINCPSCGHFQEIIFLFRAFAFEHLIIVEHMKHVVMSEMKVHQFVCSHNDVESKRPSYQREFFPVKCLFAAKPQKGIIKG